MSTKPPTIKSIDPADRPREKLLQYGPQKLSTTELIALLIGSGTKEQNVIKVAESLLKSIGIKNLGSATTKDLLDRPGIGPASAARILASIELGERLISNKQTELLLTPEDVWHSLKDIRHHKKEHVIVFYLDSRHQTIERETISIGTVDKTMVHPREVFEPAVRMAASHILLAHNHPTGNADPSEHDILLTQRLVAAGSIMGIELIDHVIVTRFGYESMKERGLM